MNSLIWTHFHSQTANTNADDVQSALSSDGVLTITANRKPIQPQDTERVVPIQQTGPSKQAEGTTSGADAKAAPASDTTTKVEWNIFHKQVKNNLRIWNHYFQVGLP